MIPLRGLGPLNDNPNTFEKIILLVEPFGVEIRTGILLSLFVTGIWLEHARPLRVSTQKKFRRVSINLSMAAIAAIVLRIAFYPVVLAISHFAAKERLGLFPQLNLHPIVELLLALVLLDYTLYFWHIMLHKIGILWRFHNVHHMDLDLDTSTALRFHFGELIISTVYRSAQIIIFGISPFQLVLFETAITSFAQFHHSNIALPLKFEKHLKNFIVTPRMHGIHHSIVKEETDSNFGTIFTLWDRLHRTFKFDIPQDEIVIGVPYYQKAEDQTLKDSLLIPFRQQKPWRTPDGKIPKRIF